ncbi:MAG: kelch repeat-containing protein [bacterium]|nr:kelch repeat-containing protein [bacterium]
MNLHRPVLSITAPSTVVALLASLSMLPGQNLRVIDRSAFAAGVFDAARGRTVAIGVAGETQEFDGSEWRIAPEALRADLRGSVMAYDRVGGRTLLLQGSSWPAVAWLHRGGSWTHRAPATTPPERGLFVLEGDPATGSFLLFGGLGQNNTLLNDTWLFDGDDWQLQQPANSPLPRSAAAAAADGQRVFVCGGSVGAVATNDTWAWDGIDWSLVPAVAPPAALTDARMTHDPVRGRLVLCSGLNGATANPDVWEFDGATWQQISPSSTVPASPGAFVFDENLGEALLLGGTTVTAAQPGVETWSWDGTRWAARWRDDRNNIWADQVFLDPVNHDPVRLGESSTSFAAMRWDGSAWQGIPGSGPSRRQNAATCTGLAYGYVFGGDGFGAAGVLSDLWGFDGSAWSLLAPAATGPGPRRHAVIEYDWSRNEVVLFGGFLPGTTAALNDTWVFDGTSWSQLNPAMRPSVRGAAAIAYDVAGGRMILFGGRDFFASSHLQDTWSWDGVNWSPVASAVQPLTVQPSMAFDSRKNRVMLVSPQRGAFGMGLWQLDPLGWRLAPRGQITIGRLFGPGIVAGFPRQNGLLLADLHNLYSLNIDEAEVAAYGTACTVTAPELSANESPQLGAVDFAVEVSHAPASSFVALLGATGSANLTIGSCTQLVQPGQAVVLLPTSPVGFVAASLPLPSSPTFLGTELFFQAAALDASAPGGFTMSRGLRLGIGD